MVDDNHTCTDPTASPLVSPPVSPVCEYGDYVMVARFDFWLECEDMGDTYHQRSFETVNIMLDWSRRYDIDWGWKGAGNYVQLF